jgi:hypothetical protein
MHGIKRSRNKIVEKSLLLFCILCCVPPSAHERSYGRIQPPTYTRLLPFTSRLRGGFDTASLFDALKQFSANGVQGANADADGGGSEPPDVTKSETWKKLDGMFSKIDRSDLEERMLEGGDADDEKIYNTEQERWDAIWKQANSHGLAIPRRPEDVPPVSRKAAQEVICPRKSADAHLKFPQQHTHHHDPASKRVYRDAEYTYVKIRP